MVGPRAMMLEEVLLKALLRILLPSKVEKHLLRIKIPKQHAFILILAHLANFSNDFCPVIFRLQIWSQWTLNTCVVLVWQR